MTTQRYPRHT